jgi:hypothetical protein
MIGVVGSRYHVLYFRLTNLSELFFVAGYV